MKGRIMKINWIHIKGFRNFVNEKINFADKTLIIGSNDVGKTNLLYAMRLLFDRSISDRDLELTDSDYNAYTSCSEIEITVEIIDIYEDCLKSVFSGAIKDGKTYIRYKNSKTGEHSFAVGFSLELLEDIPSRTYIRRLNMECVDTNRDLFQFLKREKNKLLDTAKIQLDEANTQKDKTKIQKVQKYLDTINNNINSLNYIKNSLKSVNRSLSQLSTHNEDQNIRFVAGNSDVQKLLDNIELSYSTGDAPLCVGGDGRNNQIFIATWIAKQNIQKSPDHVTFFAIEEPEAHLHPHQQRKLSQYLLDNFDEQIFITSHSPQIATGFTPKNIVRLYSINKLSKAAQEGCSRLIQLSFNDFSYRLNAISAEIFFSDGVFLVEGPSEVLFYTALAKALNIDLDKLNINILAVNGVGFKPYIKICQSLDIPYVLRTDNDIFSKDLKKGEVYYYAGILRIMSIYSKLISNDKNDRINEYWKNNKKFNEWRACQKIPQTSLDLNKNIRDMLSEYNIFLSEKDLETDLANSELIDSLYDYYKCSDIVKLIKKMQSRKAENMLAYLSKNNSKLKLLADNAITIPLWQVVQLVEKVVHPDATS